MNFPQESNARPSRDLFFRLADRLQLQACVQAVAEEGKSVVLHSPNPGLLDHYGQMLVQRLRQQLPDTPTEIFFPTHTDALLDRFNELLSHVSVDAATQTEGPSAPGKLWIVHDASALAEHELKLMARLLQHLPGARVSAVLMLNGTAPILRDLDPQGRRLVRWHIEPPTPEQTEQMVQEARQAGREFAALELVARIAPPPAAPAPLPLPELRAAPKATPAAPPAPEAAPPRARRRGLWVLLALGLMGLSVGVAAWLNPQAVDQVRAQLQGLAPSPAREASGAVSPALPPASEASAPASAATEAASAAPAASAAESSPAVAALSPASEPASAPSPAATAASAKPALVTELPELALRGLGWLRQQDKDTWMIEHSRHASVQAARKQIGTGVLTNARVVPAYRADAEAAEFVVITGPFRTDERARQFIARNALAASAKVHTTAKLLASAQAASADRPRP